MNYLNTTFSVGGPSKLDGITCEACVYGDDWGPHSENCQRVESDESYEASEALLEKRR